MKVYVARRIRILTVAEFPPFEWEGRTYTITQITCHHTAGVSYWEALATPVPSGVARVARRGELPPEVEEAVEQVFVEHFLS